MALMESPWLGRSVPSRLPGVRQGGQHAGYTPCSLPPPGAPQHSPLPWLWGRRRPPPICPLHGPSPHTPLRAPYTHPRAPSRGRGAQRERGVTSPSGRAAGCAAAPLPPAASAARLPPAPAPTAPWPSAAVPRSWETVCWAPPRPPAPGWRGVWGLLCAGESWGGTARPQPGALGGICGDGTRSHTPGPYQPVSPASLVRHGVGARLAVGQRFPNGDLGEGEGGGGSERGVKFGPSAVHRGMEQVWSGGMGWSSWDPDEWGG